jgi:hypothetical protein
MELYEWDWCPGRRDPRENHALLPCGDTEKEPSIDQEMDPLQIESAGALILDFHSPEL